MEQARLERFSTKRGSIPGRRAHSRQRRRSGARRPLSDRRDGRRGAGGMRRAGGRALAPARWRIAGRARRRAGGGGVAAELRVSTGERRSDRTGERDQPGRGPLRNVATAAGSTCTAPSRSCGRRRSMSCAVSTKRRAIAAAVRCVAGAGYSKTRWRRRAPAAPWCARPPNGRRTRRAGAGIASRCRADQGRARARPSRCDRTAAGRPATARWRPCARPYARCSLGHHPRARSPGMAPMCCTSRRRTCRRRRFRYRHWAREALGVC